jgi:hypothetical protein
VTTSRLLPMINVLPVDLEIVNEVVIVPELTVVHGPERQTPAATRHAMALLAAGVPLSLLFDLVDPAGPASADIASAETDPRTLIGDLLAFRADAAARTPSRISGMLRSLRHG